jgi:hypothetical protein
MGMNRLFVLALAVTLTASASTQTQQSQSAYRGARTPDGKPDLNGIWQSMNTANWDIQAHSAAPGRIAALGAQDAMPAGLGVVEGGALPYLPAALAKKKENFENRLTADPELKCFMPGVPRAMYQPFPFQIVQSAKGILMVFEFAEAVRTINMGKPTKSPGDTWMGWSNGRWEGDTLVIDVTSQNDQTWFDRVGDFHSDALHVVERYVPISSGVIQYEATITDPQTFSRPWKMSMPLYRHVEKNAQLLEFKCVEFAEELVYGNLRRKSEQ